MAKFLALKRKLYAYKMIGESGDKRCKGVKKCTAMKALDFEDYKQSLLAGLDAFRKQLLFWNKVHEVYTIELNKLASRSLQPLF